MPGELVFAGTLYLLVFVYTRVVAWGWLLVGEPALFYLHRALRWVAQRSDELEDAAERAGGLVGQRVRS